MKARYNVHLSVHAHAKFVVDASSPEEARDLADKLARDKISEIGWRYARIVQRELTSSSVVYNTDELPDLFETIYEVDMVCQTKTGEFSMPALKDIETFLINAGEINPKRTGYCHKMATLGQVKKHFPQYVPWAVEKAVAEWENAVNETGDAKGVISMRKKKERLAKFIRASLRARHVHISDCRGDDEKIIARAKEYVAQKRPDAPEYAGKY